MTNADLTSLRQLNQQLSQPQLSSAGAVVAGLAAMQGQDYAGVKWSIGLRLPGSTDADIEQAFADRSIIRTWPMRGTLHVVAAADARWLLALVAPRLLTANAAYYRKYELDAPTLTRIRQVLIQALQGGRQLTRPELTNALAAAGIQADGIRLSLILQNAGLEQLLCFGLRRGNEHTYTLLDEWLPPTKAMAREEALAELARRYFSSRGPATLADFTTWSGLAAADARQALALVQPQLSQAVIGGNSYWFATPASAIQPAPAALLPGFDEYLLGYQDRRPVLDAIHSAKVIPSNAMFSPTLVSEGRVVGTWKRSLNAKGVSIAVTPFGPLPEATLQLLPELAACYGTFLRLKARVSLLPSV
jgi:hypothetical protein